MEQQAHPAFFLPSLLTWLSGAGQASRVRSGSWGLTASLLLFLDGGRLYTSEAFSSWLGSCLLGIPATCRAGN